MERTSIEEISIEEIKEKINKYAEKLGIEEKDIEKVYYKFEKDLKKRDLPEEKLEETTLKRVENALKKKLFAQKNSDNVKGFVLGRSNAFDRTAKPRAKAEEYIEVHGLEKAIEKGYAQRSDKPDIEYHLTYNDFDWRKGKIIPDDEWEATGVIIFENLDGKIMVGQVKFKGKAATEPIEMYKVCDLNIFVRNKREHSCDLTMSNPPTNYSDDYVDLNDYVGVLKEAYPDKIIPTLSALGEFVAENENEFGLWCIIEANIIEISTIVRKKDGKEMTVMRLSDYSLDENLDMDEPGSITTFFPGDAKIDVRDDALGVNFVVSPWIGDEGDVILSGMGMWANSWDRTQVEDSDVPDIDDLW